MRHIFIVFLLMLIKALHLEVIDMIKRFLIYSGIADNFATFMLFFFMLLIALSLIMLGDVTATAASSLFR